MEIQILYGKATGTARIEDAATLKAYTEVFGGPAGGTDQAKADWMANHLAENTKAVAGSLARAGRVPAGVGKDAGDWGT